MSNTNNSQAIVTALSNACNSNIIGNPYWATTTTSIPEIKKNSSFRMEFFKAENGGFVMHLTYLNDTKMYILSDIQNMGRDIQNILLMKIIET